MDSSVKSFNPNNHLKQQFVSNLTGSSMLELFLLLTTLSILILIRRLIGCNNEFGHNAKEASLKKNDDAVIGSKSLSAYVDGIIVDFLIIFVPWCLFLTVLSEWIYLNLALVILVLIVFLLAKRFGYPHQEDSIPSLRENVSSYRVYMWASRYILEDMLKQRPMALAWSLRNAVRSSSPLILLGFARRIFTSSVHYQVHVGEYGVHWNFFFTLAAVAILTSLVNMPPKYCRILGILILAGYQYVLLHGLNAYLLSDKRGTDIISQNKEGIFSIFGYWGMYLVGVQLGGYLLFGNEADNILRRNQRASRVCILCLLFWTLTLFLDQFVEKVSRRMCNMTYVTLILATNLQVLAILMFFDLIPGSKLSLLEKAFNQNLLGSFLLANVLTGLVNMSIDTLFVSSAFTLAILLIYSFTLSASVGSLYFYGIKLKFG